MAELLVDREPPSDLASSRASVSLRQSDLFHAFVSLADALTAMFGSGCEAVVHDFTDLDHSIIHITGHVTGRKVGGSPTNLMLEALKQSPVPDALIRFAARSPDGHALRSASVFIKDSGGRPVGCFCLNIDANQPILAAEPGVAAEAPHQSPAETFADTPEAVTRTALNRLLAATARDDARNLSRAQKIELIRKLDQAGVFFLRGAVDIVARLLGVTRSTVYVYLRSAANNTNREVS